MKTPDDLLAAYREATTPDAQALGRVQSRLDLHRDPAALGALLRQLPPPDERALSRVLARLRESIALGRGVPSPLRPFLVAGVVGAALLLGFALTPSLVTPPAPVMIAATLEAPNQTSVGPAPGVRLDYTGWGFVSGSERQPRIQWGAGSLHVDVEPKRGIDLQIETPNGLVTVVGTVFDVDVDDLGTRVRVERGEVRVTCVLGETVALTAGQETTCARASSANLLNLAVKTRKEGKNPERLLALARQGLELGPGEQVQEELALIQFESLMDLRRSEDARDAADAYLALPTAARRTEVLRTAAKLAMVQGRCALALPYLDLLVQEGAADGAEEELLARCQAASQPE